MSFAFWELSYGGFQFHEKKEKKKKKVASMGLSCSRTELGLGVKGAARYWLLVVTLASSFATSTLRGFFFFFLVFDVCLLLGKDKIC